MKKAFLEAFTLLLGKLTLRGSLPSRLADKRPRYVTFEANLAERFSIFQSALR